MATVEGTSEPESPTVADTNAKAVVSATATESDEADNDNNGVGHNGDDKEMGVGGGGAQAAAAASKPTKSAGNNNNISANGGSSSHGGGGGGGEVGGKSSSSSAAATPYTQLIQDAIVTLNERTGSSQPAILKWILSSHPEIDPNKLKQRFLLSLKNGVKTKRFVKIKCSYKMHADFMARWRKKTSAPVKKKPIQAVPPPPPPVKKEPTAAEIAARLERERRASREKDRQDRVRRRRFPMDDLRLVEEDRALRVSVNLPSRPTLELAFPDFPSACRSDTMGTGVVDDILHIYHVFAGDVGWGKWPKQKTVVAPFTLDQLLQCVQQVMRGWSKRARMVPPLLSHLFVAALLHLSPPKLAVALTPASWSEVLLLYMDAMERYYTTEASTAPNVLPSVGIDAEYLFFATDERREAEFLEAPKPPEPFYLRGGLERAHSKLLSQDPWTLSAEELLALLRALVDDVVATSPDCAEELDIRLDETYELLKRKRTADANCRKLLVAHNKEVAEETKDRTTNGGEADLATRSTVKMTKISEAQLDKARKEQQRANELYEKTCAGKPIRTGPTGLDRNFNEVYHAWNDPERLYVLQRGKAIPSTLPFESGYDSYRLTWHTIDKRSTLDRYLESLDVRGVREQGLHEALQPIKRLVYDDVKELNAKKAVLKEKNHVKRRLENARLKFETGRKSGRLVAQSEQELFDLQDEIDRLEKSIEEGNVVKEYDFEVATGLQMLRDFDAQDSLNQRRRATRRDANKRQKLEEEDTLPKLPCSRLWPSGHIDGTGMVGLIASQLLELEERIEKLVSWENAARKAWIANLETAVHAWNEGTLLVLGGEASGLASPDPTCPNQRTSAMQGSGVSACTAQSSAMSPHQVLSMIKQPLLDLEKRVFEASGLAMAAKDADDADDNMSTSPEDEEEQVKYAWKKLIHRLKRVPAKANAKIRESVIEAIAAARKAHNTIVVAQLREALLQYHPEAAGLCKATALEVLAKHGDFQDQDDDDDEEDDDKDDVEEERDNPREKTTESGISGALCAEAVTLISSLDGQEDASREDWILAVKKAKTLSKMAALVSAFCYSASAKLGKMEAEQAALADVMTAWGIPESARKKKGAQNVIEASEVWANVDFSDEFCLVKVDPYPWWPARKCTPIDTTLAGQLESLGRVFVSLIGESGGLRVVKDDALLPFSETPPEDKDLINQPREIRSQLDDCLAMTRRIVRGKQKKVTEA